MSHRNNRWTAVIAFTLLFALTGAVACGSDDTSGGGTDGKDNQGQEELVGEDSRFVGGGCFDNDGCEEICMTGSDWPGGMCTLQCDDDTDCPDLSYCIAFERGICLMDCIEDEDCPIGYRCDDEDRHGHRGDIYVCVKD